MLKIDLVNIGFSTNDFSKNIEKALNGVLSKYRNNEIGFIDLDENNFIKKIKKLVEKGKDDFENVVVLGIGGSALGTKAIFSAIKGKYYNELSKKKRGGFPKLYILDNVDSEEIKNISDVISFKKTLFIVISKSGTTIETISQYNFFKEKILKKGLNLKKHFIFIAGENSQFAIEKENEGFKVFSIPENVGGRFSVLSNVGLLPLAFAGIDIEKLLLGQKNYKSSFFENNLIKNIALNSAFLQFNAYKNFKNITVFFPYSSNLRDFGLWYKQLFNESLGKNNLGLTLTNSIGTTDQHSDLQLYSDGLNNKFIIFLEIEKFKKDYKIEKSKKMKFSDLMNLEKYGTEKSLTKKGIFNYTIKIDSLSEQTVGELIFFFEMQIAFLGEFLEINAFNQPGVEQSKKITKDRINQLFGEN
ncbi:glucose-6-phosphate isomerase [Candidatus Gracilibacteria bacterium]|nr:MAG: glucose-6-phosphate isomerase [Candidatus Gracilibacteria bacterium]